MKQWHCLVGGQQYGPISEEKLREWIGQGRVKLSDYVWCEGMDEWKFLKDVPELNVGVVLPPPFTGTLPRPRGGSGGNTPNSQITDRALDSLRGKWGLSIGFCLLWGVMAMICQMIPYVGGWVWLVLAGPFLLGSVIYFLHITRGRDGDLGQLFAGFKQFGQALGVHILSGIFVFLWTMLALLPGLVIVLIAMATLRAAPDEESLFILLPLILLGILPPIIVSIVKRLSYSQALYLVADNPKLKILEAIRTSQKMMAENKGKLFCIDLRVFGWSLLCLLTLGIGFLWLAPYANALYAAFYNDLLPPDSGGAVASTPDAPQNGPGPW